LPGNTYSRASPGKPASSILFPIVGFLPSSSFPPSSPLPFHTSFSLLHPHTPPEMAHLRLPAMATPPVPISGRLESNCERTGPSDLSHHFNRVTRERTASAIKTLYKYFQVPDMMNLAGGTLSFVYCLRIKMIVSLVC